MRLRYAVVVVLGLLAAAGVLMAQQPAQPGFDAASLDKNVDPCEDFYQFSCGGWLAKNPIPGDQSRWGRFNELAERNREILHQALEKASVSAPNRGANEQKIGDYYASCMDEKAIEAKGLAPLKPELDRINALKSKLELPELVGRLHRLGVNVVFGVAANQDMKDATQVIADFDQGGIGLPERDYYFRDDAKSVELRKAYVQHIQNMFTLMGDPAVKAAAQAKAVMDFETALAKASLDVVSRRDPNKLYHKMTVAELQKLTPAFAWNRYLTTAEVPNSAAMNVSVPAFFTAMQTLVEKTPLDTWKTYLRWNLARSAAPLLPEKFVQENFNFYNKTLSGQKEQRARWKRCVAYTDADLGEALGQAFVEKAFGANSKEDTLKMVDAIEKAMAADIDQIDWMTPETKKAAHAKLEKVANKIGYPDKWRDYSKLQIVRGDALGNSFRSNEFEFNRQMNKIGKPVDRKEWAMTPPTVNAYYNPQMNDINFPAGILQPPFYLYGRDDTYNFGGIGAVIGHELTHGFDDEGRQFDGDGNLRDWWTAADNQAFEKRGECFVEQYSSYTAVDDVNLNGKLTLGENVADNGGLRLALVAALASLTEKNKGEVDGYTPEQRVFLGFGQIWCTNQTPEIARMLAQVDPHSAPKFRVNGTVSNMPEFQKAWGCKAGQKMVRQNACRVW
ncbi:MAG TPA: M13 family metallopeptidase [Terriglobales bacterium]|nr:M13 family metallopeptidase [Terriglobales bacterium]